MLAKLQAYPPRHRGPASLKNSRLDGTELCLVPSGICPDCFVLIAPVSLLAAVQPRELTQQHGDVRLLSEEVGLLGVEIIQAIARHRMSGVRPVIRCERLLRERKFRWAVHLTMSNDVLQLCGKWFTFGPKFAQESN